MVKENAVHFLMLDVSTAHVSMDTLQFLNDRAAADPGAGLIVYAKAEYGFFLPITDVMPDELPQDLATVIQFATQQSCSWIMFDADGNHIEQLPVYPY